MGTQLLELLKAHKKAIRRATVNTFGYIAKAIGPQDVLATLLNNLKVRATLDLGWGRARGGGQRQRPSVGPSPLHLAVGCAGARASEPRVHDGGHRHCCGDVRSFYGVAGFDERVPRAGAQRAQRCPEVALLPL